jgi:hypothetical protein
VETSNITQLNLDSVFLLGVLRKDDECEKTIDARGLFKMGFVQGPQKFND